MGSLLVARVRAPGKGVPERAGQVTRPASVRPHRLRRIRTVSRKTSQLSRSEANMSSDPRGAVHSDRAPRPVGACPHARRVGDLLFVSGMGPRQPGTDEIPGGPIRDAAGNTLPYDVALQTRAVIENIRRVL